MIFTCKDIEQLKLCARDFNKVINDEIIGNTYEFTCVDFYYYAEYIACWIIPSKKSRPSWKEVAMIAVTTASVFAILDLFSPSISRSARWGSDRALWAEFDSNKLR